MFGFNAKRRNTHYRETMRELQPSATESSALRLAGYYRGWDVLVPLMLVGQPQSPRPRRDY